MSGRGDPAVRAEQAVQRLARVQKLSRLFAVTVLAGAAFAVPFLVDATVGTPGSVIGALLVSAFLTGMAVVAWPGEWSTSEAEHHRLEAIWSEARTDAGENVPWERYAAWALEQGEHVELVELTCAPTTSSHPRRLRQQRGERFDAEAMADAAGAMARFRERCEERELAAGPLRRSAPGRAAG